MSEDSKKGKGRLRDRLGGLSVGDAAELLVLARQRIREAPVEHAKAAADVTRSLSEARSQLPGPSFQAMRRAVLLVARRDWAAAAILADALTDLVREHPDSVDWVGEAVARAVQADRTLARQLVIAAQLLEVMGAADGADFLRSIGVFGLPPEAALVGLRDAIVRHRAARTLTAALGAAPRPELVEEAVRTFTAPAAVANAPAAGPSPDKWDLPVPGQLYTVTRYLPVPLHE